MALVQGCRDTGTLCPVCGNVKRYNCCGKQYGSSSKHERTEIPYEPIILVLGIYPKKMKTLIQKDTRTLMFIATLFTLAKMWKQPEYPSKDEEMNE